MGLQRILTRLRVELLKIKPLPVRQAMVECRHVKGVQKFLVQLFVGEHTHLTLNSPLDRRESYLSVQLPIR